MTVRQKQIADYIDLYWQTHWTSPSVRQIGEHLGLSSPSTAHAHLMDMVRAGILERHRVSSLRVLYRMIR